MLVQILVLAFLGLVIFAALHDIASFKIPNWVCLAIIGLFPVYGIVAGLDLNAWGGHMLGGALGLLLGMALFATGGLGGGDGKLFAAAALWFGWSDFFSFLFLTMLAGGGLAVILLMVRRTLTENIALGGILTHRAFAMGEPVPYGVAIAAGALWCLPFASILPAG